MLAVAVVGFSIVISNGNGFFDSQPAGYVAPITLGLLIGSFLFGLGMQLGGSCASGTLYATGSGHIGVLVTLIGFVAGSGVGVAHSGFWSSAGNGFVKLADPFSFTADIGAVGGTIVLVAILAVVALGVEQVIRRRRPPQIEPAPVATGPARFLRGSWPLWVGAIALGLLNVVVLAVSGRPCGVTSAFRLWASKILDGAGVDVSTWSYWDEACRTGLSALYRYNNCVEHRNHHRGSCCLSCGRIICPRPQGASPAHRCGVNWRSADGLRCRLHA